MADSPIGGGSQDLVSVQLNGVKYLGQIVQLLKQILPRITGTFTMPAAATLAIANPLIQAGSIVTLQAANASAATLEGSAKALYISVISPGVGFTVATANATNAAGTEKFVYSAINPV